MAMENRGEIISCDLHGGKLPQIEKAAQRLGVTIVHTMENDGTQLRPEFQAAFDAVIADVPCSGLGVIRKKPDIRYKDLSGLEALPALQSRILENAAAYVKKGGALLYSTCTILKRENEAVVQEFLKSSPQFQAEELLLPEPLISHNVGMLSLYQGIHDCDGFFLCRMRRRS
jgi:16S rRNA (cytosine967-C5)-methyltransferase